MLKLPFLLSGLLLASTTDPVWWRTDGGTVTEHQDRDAATCTLQIYNGEGQFSLLWDHSLPTRVVVEQPGWTFAPDQITSVAMRVGPAWLEGGHGEPNIIAMTGSSALMFIVTQPIDDLLSSANEITLQTPNTRFGITLIRSKMQALVAALRKCRQANSR